LMVYEREADLPLLGINSFCLAATVLTSFALSRKQKQHT
jgi:hypothetical protein